MSSLTSHMGKIAIVSDSTADMPDEMIKDLDIRIAHAFVIIGTDTYVMGELGLDQFYSIMESVDKSSWPKTSQPRANDLLEIYEEVRAAGYDTVLSIHVTSQLSGTINSVNVAKGMIDGIDIRIIDSKGTSANLIAVLLEARKLIDSGKEVDAICEELDEFSGKLASYLTIKSLDNLVKGGRISRIRYRFGRLFNFKPILCLSQGKLEAIGKSRGFDRAREKVYEIATSPFSKGDAFNFIVAHTREKEMAKEVVDRLQREFPRSTGFIIEIGIVVAVHAGPGGILMLLY